MSKAHSLEKENQELQKAQTRRINDSVRTLRRISRASLREESSLEASAQLASSAPGFYVESPGSVERVVDDTGKFCIPEPDTNAVVTMAINQAFSIIDQERREFRSNKDSPVVKRWKIL